MTLSPRHERSKKLIGRMIEAMTEELNIPIRSGGSTTFKKELRRRGSSPTSATGWPTSPRYADRADLDIEVDPPPDIAVEVEISTARSTGWGSMPRSASRKSGEAMGTGSRSRNSRMTGPIRFRVPQPKFPLAAPGGAQPIPRLQARPWARLRGSAHSASGFATNCAPWLLSLKSRDPTDRCPGE